MSGFEKWGLTLSLPNFRRRLPNSHPKLLARYIPRFSGARAFSGVSGELSTKPSRPILAFEGVSTFYQGCVCPRKYRYQVRIWVASFDVPPSLRETRGLWSILGIAIARLLVSTAYSVEKLRSFAGRIAKCTRSTQKLFCYPTIWLPRI
jgi:hypothetical protein